MAFVTTLHLQTSADAALSCKPGRPVTRGGHEQGLFATSADAEQRANVPHQMFALFSHATFVFCLRSGVNPA